MRTIQPATLFGLGPMACALVSNLNGSPLDADGNGFIRRLSPTAPLAP
jgi:hypothetical protein